MVEASPPLAASAFQRLLNPQSVVIVGASERVGSLGGSVLNNLERAGFAGSIHLVNPRQDTLGGRPCLASLASLPHGVDVAVLAVPRAAVLDSVRSLASLGVGGVIIFAAGFAEAGETGMAEQRMIGEVAREAGMVVVGPNCLGIVNHSAGVPLTFAEAAITPPGAGRQGIGIISQSGAMASVLGIALASRDLGLTVSLSTGNEAGSGVEDYVEYIIDDRATKVIAMIVEQFRAPRRFLASARRARAIGKIIVLLHPGRSSAARESAATHTGAMAGDYDVMRVLVLRAGVVVAQTLEELGDIAEIAMRCPVLPFGGTAILAESGAFKALTLGLCEELGVLLPVLDDANAPALRRAMPDFVAVSNPLDLTAQGLVDPDLYRRTLLALFDDDRFGTIVSCIIQTGDLTSAIKFPPITQAVHDAKPAKAVILAGPDEGAAVPGEYIAGLRNLGVPYFPSTERVFRAIKRLADSSAINPAPANVSQTAPPFQALTGVIPEYLAKQHLAPLGIPFPAGGFATTADEAVKVADALGYSVAIKAQSVELSHKSEAGGVILNLSSAADVRDAFARLYDNAARHRPGLRLAGVLVEAMLRHQPNLNLEARPR